MSWYCNICKEEMEEVDDIAISFGEISLPEAEGIRCPKCGKEYLLADYVVDELSSAEQMLSGK